MLLGPVPPSGRRTKNGSLGQDIVWAGTFWRKTMKNQPGTMKNLENQSVIIQNQSESVKNYANSVTGGHG